MDNSNTISPEEIIVRKEWHLYFSNELKNNKHQLTSTPKRTPIKGPPKGAIIVTRKNYRDLFFPSSPSERRNKTTHDDSTLADLSCTATMESSNLVDSPSPKRKRRSEDGSPTSDLCSDSRSDGEDVTIPYNNSSCGLC